MKHISNAFNLDTLAEKREEWKQRAEEYRAENHRLYGWPLDADCTYCGDTGRSAEGTICHCPAGRRAQDDERHETGWTRLVPERFQGYRLATAPDTGAAKAVATWLDDEPWQRGSNLIIVGPVGTGKTGLAIGAYRVVYDLKSVYPRLYGVPAMLERMRPDGDLTVEDVIKHKLIVLDDLGVEKASEWVRERLYLIINGRYEAQRSTIVTTNCNLDKLADLIGERTVSRLQEDATIVPVGGKDRRRA